MKNNKQNITPIGDNILVKITKEPKKTTTGIVLPEIADHDRPQKGIIIAVGDDKKIKVKINQKVLFAKYSGTEIKINEEDYLILKSEDILAIIK